MRRHVEGLKLTGGKLKLHTQLDSLNSDSGETKTKRTLEKGLLRVPLACPQAGNNIV